MSGNSYNGIKLEPIGPIGIIGHTANKSFVEKVSRTLSDKRHKRVENDASPFINRPGYLRSDYVIDADLIRFQTGEGKFAMGESVRGHDVFIITDCVSPNLRIDLIDGDHIMSPDDHYRDLLRIVSTCVGKARRINVIMPFVYEGRTETRQNLRASLDCSAMLRQLYDLGVANFICFDPHDERIQNSVPLMGIEMPKSQYKLTTTLLGNFGSLKIDKDSTMVVSPDEMGVSRAIFYSSALSLPLGIFYRDRDYTVKVNGEHPIKSYRFLGDDVAGKDIILIDDMINSGSTMLRTATKLNSMGAKDIFCISPFGLFTDGLDAFDEAYEKGIIKAVVCTNLIYRSEEVLSRDWYYDADMVPYIARIIDGLNVDESVYDLINSTTRLSEYVKQIRIGEVFDEFND
ncbi:ribose-phosphate pyrophosphokinase [Ruminococcaceae bacterium YRB3002]|nr:ribose-phosphate pyrophosphokinase [Ruminococcaceae bacterium YRB3002]